MSILQQGIVPASAGGYEIANSLRFNDNDSAYLSWTPSSAGNRKTWTWSGWVKQCSTAAATRSMFGATGGDLMGFNSAHKFFLMLNTESSGNLKSEQVFRDVSAWYHFVVAVDTTQSTSSNRVKIYVNGEQMTDFQSGHETYPSQNYDTAINNSVLQQINRHPNTSSHFNDMYLAEVNFIDGQALDPSNFGETGDYGEWKPIKYTGTYGTNGFYLDFENSGSLGADVSGNGNNWTPTNLAATDQMLDSPTNNFATWNPLAKEVNPPTFYEGNLKAAETAGTTWRTGYSWLMSSGKWYWEITPTATSGSYNLTKIGIVSESENIAAANAQNFTKALWYDMEGTKRQGTSATSYGSSYTAGDVIGVALDMDSNTITFYKNNVSQGELDLTTLNVGTDNVYLAFAVVGYYAVLNSGQDSSFAGNKTAQGNTDGNGYGDFYYTPPSGYLALCTQNLPDPTVIPSEHFNTVLYTGTGATEQSITVGFQPDFTWIKQRNEANSHALFDSLRGVSYKLNSNSTGAESDWTSVGKGVTSFNANGFSVEDDSVGNYEVNGSSDSLVAWNWKANGSGVSNTNGTITSTVSANQDAGFSIVSWVGTDGADSVGHGLDSAPELLILKNRSRASTWRVHDNISGKTNGRMDLNGTGAENTTNHQITFQSTTFTFNTDSGAHEDWNQLNENIIAYCFHSVDGYSKVGSYTGNGSADGTFVYTGFRPAYVMIKRTNDYSHWEIHDTAREPYNVKTKLLNANQSNAEDNNSNSSVDFISNGFKLRTLHAERNQSGGSFIFIAFAETPFKHSNGA